MIAVGLFEEVVGEDNLADLKAAQSGVQHHSQQCGKIRRQKMSRHRTCSLKNSQQNLNRSSHIRRSPQSQRSLKTNPLKPPQERGLCFITSILQGR